MTERCAEVQELVATEGPAILRTDVAAGDHVAGCGACQGVIAALARLDADLPAMLPPIDAPAALAARVATTVRRDAVAPPPSRPTPEPVPRHRSAVLVASSVRVGGLVAATLAVSVAIGMLYSSRASYQSASLAGDEDEAAAPADRMDGPQAVNAPAAPPALRDERGAAKLAAAPAPAELETKQKEGPEKRRAFAEADRAGAVAADSEPAWPGNDKVAESGNVGAKLESIDAIAMQRANELQEGTANYFAQQQAVGKAKNDRQSLAKDSVANFQEVASATSPSEEADERHARRERQRPGLPSPQSSGERMTMASEIADDKLVVATGGQRGEQFRDQLGAGSRVVASTPDLDKARAFVRSRELVPGQRFQEATGYWANTYVPGDPTIRLLEARLTTGQQLVFTRGDGRALGLDRWSRPYRQPFDPPLNSAVAVFLHADRNGFSGPTRMLVQIGLQGTRRQSGLRPAMNVGVVLDLSSPITAEVSVLMRAFITALSDAQQTGDRFSLTVGGGGGGTVVPAASFRHGAVAVALRQIFGEGAAATGGTLDLATAVSQAMRDVASGDDPDEPLGASTVLLVTGSTLGPSLPSLERVAHSSAVAGVPLGVIAVGAEVNLDEIDRLTLAGQGSRRVLLAASEAEPLVDRELHAASRVVARAVRLRVRLAPGVKLIDVIGSRRLDTQNAERVREAENSIDLRVARNLGIVADRGEDEEGIQIVLPTYQAGDAHVILLDVVAEHPGAIADVTVRYKDLVYLRNGIGRANLSLAGRAEVPGPLERNVLKNLVAAHLSAAIRDAGSALASGDVDGARRTVADQVALLAGLCQEVPGWASDQELVNDIQMLGEYTAALESAVAASDHGRRQLSDSMRYAGHLKVQTRQR